MSGWAGVKEMDGEGGRKKSCHYCVAKGKYPRSTHPCQMPMGEFSQSWGSTQDTPNIVCGVSEHQEIHRSVHMPTSFQGRKMGKLLPGPWTQLTEVP